MKRRRRERQDVGRMAANDKQLYERDPEAWNTYLAEGNAKQPRKRVAADVIIRDEHGRILLVNPTYKRDWDLPGGMVEANEPPINAARRELREELSLDVHLGALLCVDWIPPHGPWDDTVIFVFDGGVLSATAIEQLQIADHELSDFRFCAIEDAAGLLRPYVWQRASMALDALHSGRTRYMHRGEPPD
jgi:8-oxo-dGTP diphosphatase